VLYCTSPRSPVTPLAECRGLERPRPCSLRDTAPPPPSAIVGLVSNASLVAKRAHMHRLCLSVESMHIETAWLMKTLANEPRYAGSVPPSEAGKAGERLTRPPCPHCPTGEGRWVEGLTVRHRVDSFICVACDHFWTAPMSTRADLPSFVLADPRR
jgi:hypothetical protein